MVPGQLVQLRLHILIECDLLWLQSALLLCPVPHLESSMRPGGDLDAMSLPAVSAACCSQHAAQLVRDIDTPSSFATRLDTTRLRVDFHFALHM